RSRVRIPARSPGGLWAHSDLLLNNPFYPNALASPAVASPLLSCPVALPLLSRRPCCPVVSPLLSRRFAPAVPPRRISPVPSRPSCPVASVPSRRMRRACLSRRVAPSVSSRPAALRCPSVSRCPSHPATLRLPALSGRVALPVPSPCTAPSPMAITIYFIATSLPDRLASICDALLLKHPSELTIEVLESALKDVKSNLRSVASASGAVPPPLFHGCTVPQLPTFFASLATATTDVTTKSVTTSSRSRGRSGRRGDQGAGGGGEGGGGGVASGGGGSTEVGGATHAAASDSPATAGGGDARVRQAPTGSPATGAGEAAWYLTQRQQQQ
ncbi:unnamed protein product, partial [Closterium sp. NIES-54]